MKLIKTEDVASFLVDFPTETNTKIYLGVDSKTERRGDKWIATFYEVCVIHKNGCNGCKIFGGLFKEIDHNRASPRFRLMKEVYQVGELYHRLESVIHDYPIEIHLDLNPSDKHVSHTIIKEAIGYIRGICNIEAEIKPNAFAASYAADRLGRVPDLRIAAQMPT